MTIDEMIDRTLEHEGGYVDHPADRGGPTNFGITLGTLSAWRGRPASAADVRDLDLAEARRIYRESYYLRPRIDTLPAPVQPQAFDIAINSGPSRAVKMVQKAVNGGGFGPIAVDGVMGPTTAGKAAEAQRAMGPLFNDAIVEERKAFYVRIVAGDPSQKVFLRGWLRRAESFLIELKPEVA